MSKDLYITWDFSSKVKQKPNVEFAEMDSETKEIKVLLSKNDKTGIWCLTELIKQHIDNIKKYHSEQGDEPLWCCECQHYHDYGLGTEGKCEKDNEERVYCDFACRMFKSKSMFPPTNFDKITENVDSFVKWIEETFGIIPESVPCSITMECVKEYKCNKCFKKWLQQEKE